MLVYWYIGMSFSCHQRQEKNEKKRRLRVYILLSPTAEKVTKGNLLIVLLSLSCHQLQESNQRKAAHGEGRSKIRFVLIFKALSDLQNEFLTYPLPPENP